MRLIEDSLFFFRGPAARLNCCIMIDFKPLEKAKKMHSMEILAVWEQDSVEHFHETGLFRAVQKTHRTAVPNIRGQTAVCLLTKNECRSAVGLKEND